MKIELTEEQFALVQKVSDTKDYVDHMMNKNIGHYEMSDLIDSYRSENLVIVSK